jgi:hypothetical protein
MVAAEVCATAQSKPPSEWLAQDQVRQEARRLVHEANHDPNTSVATTQDLPNILTDNILANCQISMSLEQLLALVPCFRNHSEQLFHPSVNEEPKLPFSLLIQQTDLWF